MAARQRKIGERLPTPKLSNAVNELTVREYEDIIADFNQSKTRKAYQELVIWHRGRIPYDPAAEKERFSRQNLNSLRKASFRKLVETKKRLFSELPKTLVQFQKLYLSLGLEELKAALIHIETELISAKAAAYLERVVKILELKLQICNFLEESFGEDIDSLEIVSEIDESMFITALATEIKIWKDQRIPKVLDQYNKAGSINNKVGIEYANSIVFRKDISQDYRKLVSDKMLLDEFFAFIQSRKLDATHCAENVCKIHSEFGTLSPSDHAKLLWRLSGYYADTKDLKSATRILRYFEEAKPEDFPNSPIYLVKYLISLSLLCIDSGEASFGNKCIKIYQRNRKAIVNWENSKEKFILLLCLIAINLSSRNVEEVNFFLDIFHRMKDQRPKLQYKIQLMVFHLIALFESRDAIGMSSFSKNYLRFLKKHTPFSSPAISILLFLRKHVKRKRGNSIDKDFQTLLAELREYELRPPTNLGLWYFPFYNWAESVKTHLG